MSDKHSANELKGFDIVLFVWECEFPEASVDRRVVVLGESCNGFFAEGPCMFSAVELL
jgi:hypothetical protein